jgi:hypothetical protein
MAQDRQIGFWFAVILGPKWLNKAGNLQAKGAKIRTSKGQKKKPVSKHRGNGRSFSLRQHGEEKICLH